MHRKEEGRKTRKNSTRYTQEIHVSSDKVKPVEITMKFNPTLDGFPL